MYHRRVNLAAGGSAEAVGPGARRTLRQRGARMLAASLPVLFALASFGPSDLLTSLPHKQGLPAATSPEEALRNLMKLDRSTAAFNNRPPESWTRLPYGDMSIAAPPPGPAARPHLAAPYPDPCPRPAGASPEQQPASGRAAPGDTPGVGTAEDTRPAAAGEEPLAAPGGGEGGGGGTTRRRRQRQRQQEQPLHPAPGAAPGLVPAAEPVAPTDLAACSITALVEPVMQVLSAHTRAAERDLSRNAESRARLEDAVQTVRQQLTDMRQQLHDLEQERLAAAGRGEYGVASALRSLADELAVQIAAREQSSRQTQDQIDALAELETAVRQKQAGQLLWLHSELRSLSRGAEAAIGRLQSELQQLQENLNAAMVTRSEIGQDLSTAAQTSEVRRELRLLAEAVQGVAGRAAAQLEEDRAANRAVLSDATGLATQLSAADSVAHEAALELALLRGRRELALQLQDYEYADRLSAALSELRTVTEEGEGSMVALEKLLAANQAVVRQRLADFQHHLMSFERASELVRHVRDLRDMYGSNQVDDREALALAATLSSALEELNRSEPARLLRNGEDEEVVRQVLA